MGYYAIIFRCLLTVVVSCYVFSVRSQALDSSAGCGQRVGIPSVIQWTWGLDGRFNDRESTSQGLDFYAWALNKNTSGTYVLARVRFDSNGILDRSGKIAQLGDASACISDNLISFDSDPLSTKESISIVLDYQSIFHEVSMPNIMVGGQYMTDKKVATLSSWANNPPLYFMTTGYFASDRQVPNQSKENGLPLRPSMISGGAGAQQGHGLHEYPLNIPTSQYADAYISALETVDKARFAACANDSGRSFCTYGPTNIVSTVRENKIWQFDFIAVKPVGKSVQVPSFSDRFLPSIMIHRAFGFKGQANKSFEQTVLCIVGQYAALNSYLGRGITCPAQPASNRPLVPHQPSCVALLNVPNEELLALAFANSKSNQAKLDGLEPVALAVDCLGYEDALPKNIHMTFLPLLALEQPDRIAEVSRQLSLVVLVPDSNVSVCPVTATENMHLVSFAKEYGHSEGRQILVHSAINPTTYYSRLCVQQNSFTHQNSALLTEFELVLDYQ